MLNLGSLLFCMYVASLPLKYRINVNSHKIVIRESRLKIFLRIADNHYEVTHFTLF